MNHESVRIGVVGLGYVGLPLAVEFGKRYRTVGFDINPSRVRELARGRDSTLEVSRTELKEAKHLSYSSELADIRRCNVYIVTVPTPIDKYNRPDLTPLEKSSASVGKVLKKGDIVIYESTGVKKFAYPFSSVCPDCVSTKISLWATALSASIRVIRTTASLPSRR